MGKKTSDKPPAEEQHPRKNVRIAQVKKASWRYSVLSTVLFYLLLLVVIVIVLLLCAAVVAHVASLIDVNPGDVIRDCFSLGGFVGFLIPIYFSCQQIAEDYEMVVDAHENGENWVAKYDRIRTPFRRIASYVDSVRRRRR